MAKTLNPLLHFLQCKPRDIARLSGSSIKMLFIIFHFSFMTIKIPQLRARLGFVRHCSSLSPRALAARRRKGMKKGGGR